ncbi:hypothetical protein [Micromonospora sp. NPDC049799]|uniref:hypothetical protein n=1 Tax=Micromonospora sp. NPDC049799 TaxID=3154741 RepID=UPI0033CD1D0C
MRTIGSRIGALTAGVLLSGSLAVAATPASASASEAPRADAAPVRTASAPVGSLAIQGCAITPYKVTTRGPIKGKVKTVNCSGWQVWYGMQVHRWHGWTRIAGRDAFAGSSGTKEYTVKACKLGTFNYRMYVGRNGGFPRAVQIRNSGSVRRSC